MALNTQQPAPHDRHATLSRLMNTAVWGMCVSLCTIASHLLERMAHRAGLVAARHSGVVGFQGAKSFHGAFTVSSGHVQAA